MNIARGRGSNEKLGRADKWDIILLVMIKNSVIDCFINVILEHFNCLLNYYDIMMLCPWILKLEASPAFHCHCE